MKALPAQRYIVIEGPIGVGKTSLARRVAEALGAETVLEQADQNPFLERFYRNPKAGALPAQLYFLFQRAQQLAALRQHVTIEPADFQPGPASGDPRRDARGILAKQRDFLRAAAKVIKLREVVRALEKMADRKEALLTELGGSR